MNQKIYILTSCKNDADIIPYVIPYWKKFAYKVIIFLSDSSDFSKELLKEFPELIYIFEDISKYNEYINNINDADYILKCNIDCVIANTNNNEQNALYSINEYMAIGNFPNECNFKENLIQDYNLEYCKITPTSSIINMHQSNVHKKLDIINLNQIRQKYVNSNLLGKLRCELNDSAYMEYNIEDKRYKPLKQKIIQLQKQNNDISTSKLEGISIKNKECAIIVPVYKSQIKKIEYESLKQLVNVVNNAYQIILVYPEGLYWQYYRNILNYNFGLLELNSQYFQSVWTYNLLCQRYEFYELFRDYKYMLIYQLDGWIFYNDIDKFCKMNYDYIGSPWKAEKYNVGNGGVSLRKISTFIDVCKQITPSNRKFEDFLFSEDYSNMLNIAPLDIAIQFSLCEDPEYFWNKLKKDTPMCVHDTKNIFWRIKNLIHKSKYN